MAARAMLLALSVFNLVFGAIALVAAGWLLEMGLVSTRLVALLGFLFVGLQVGQTVGFQVAAGGDANGASGRRLTRLLVPTAALIVPLAWFLPDALTDLAPVLVSVMAVGFGLVHGTVGSQALFGAGRPAFQRLLFQRNVSVGIALLLAAALFQDELRVVTAASVLCLAFSLWPHRIVGGTTPSGAATERGYLATMALGVATSLLYRNDVNVVRFAFRYDEDFLAMHYGLTAYSVLIALSGFLVTNFLYPRLRETRHSMERLLIPALPLSALSLVPLALIALSSETFSVLGFALIPVAGVLAPVASAFIHSEGRSTFVYLTGAVWFCLLLLAPMLGGGMTTMNHFLGYVLVVLLTLSMRLSPRAAQG